MTIPVNFDAFLGNRHCIEVLRRALEQDRLPHAMIFAGPDGVGKKTLALLLAQSLNCLGDSRGEICGACASCRKIGAGSHPDVRIVEPDGAYIKIDQVRAVIGEIAFQPFEARRRVVVFDEADRMRLEGANSLLKTLEEPPSRTILILVTTRPYMLLGTICSRSQLLRFGGIPPQAIEAHLLREGRAKETARLAAAFSGGSLAAALNFDLERYRQLREKAFQFVSMILRRRGLVDFNPLAEAVAKDKDSFGAWLDLVEALLQDVYYAGTARERMRQPDIAEALLRLSAETPRERLLSLIKAVRILRGGLHLNLNRQMALEALFLSETGRCA